MLGNFTFSSPGPGKLLVDCECSHLKTSISTFFPFSFSFPFPGYCGPALTTMSSFPNGYNIHSPYTFRQDLSDKPKIRISGIRKKYYRREKRRHRMPPSRPIKKNTSAMISSHSIKNIRGATAPKSQDRLKWLLPDRSTGDLVVSKAFLNFKISFVNRISLLLISSIYPIGLTGLGGPRSRPYTSRKISRL